MSSQADDRCPRCGGTFRCGVDAAAPCACTTMHLSAATLAELRGRYTSCLCIACLTELAAHEKAGPVSRPAGLRGAPRDQSLR